MESWIRFVGVFVAMSSEDWMMTWLLLAANDTVHPIFTLPSDVAVVVVFVGRLVLVVVAVEGVLVVIAVGIVL